MTGQSGGNANGLPVGGVLAGTLPSPSFATNGTSALLGTVAAQLGAPLNGQAGNQWNDILLLALTAGTWLIDGLAEMLTGGSTTSLALRLWDGSVVIYDERGSSAAPNTILSLFTRSQAVVVPVSLTVHLAGRANAAYGVDSVNSLGGSGNHATFMQALRIG